jgi:hypothetical protein
MKSLKPTLPIILLLTLIVASAYPERADIKTDGKKYWVVYHCGFFWHTAETKWDTKEEAIWSAKNIWLKIGETKSETNILTIYK